MKKALISLTCFVFLVVLSSVNAAESDWNWTKGSTEIFPSEFIYPSLVVEDVDKWWVRTHELNELIYNGDGSWGEGASSWCSGSSTTPLVRITGYTVMAYIYAHRISGIALYRQRAIEGLEHLLDEQIKTGSNTGAFREYFFSNTGSAHILDTGIAGVALVEGYKQFNDSRYLNASNLAAEWVARRPVSSNANYNARGIWFLTRHYNLTENTNSLDNAVRLALGMLNGQTDEGYWSDVHNQKMWYHEAIMQSLIELLAVIPTDHVSYSQISEGTYLAINHLISYQDSGGGAYSDLSKTTINLEDHAITSLGKSYKSLMMPTLNILNGLANYQFGLPYTGLNATGDPTPEEPCWQNSFRPHNSGYMVEFIRELNVSTTYTTSNNNSITKNLTVKLYNLNATAQEQETEIGLLQSVVDTLKEFVKKIYDALPKKWKKKIGEWLF